MMSEPLPVQLANLRPGGDRGEALARRHGAYRDAEIAPLAEALVEELAEVAPWVARPAFDGEVLAVARAQAMAELLWRHLVEVGPVDGRGKPRPALEAWHRAEARAERLRQNLGLSPRSWAALLRSMSESGGDEDAIEQLKAEGRRILEAREGEG